MKKEYRVLLIEARQKDAEIAIQELKKGLNIQTSLLVQKLDDYLESLEKFQPDLIISDYKLPEFDALVALMYKNEKVPQIPFIILTSSINEVTAVECMKAGADDYVMKEHIKRLSVAAVNAIKKRKNENEQIKITRQLAESENQLNLIINNIIEVVFLLDLKFTFTYVTPSVYRVTGYSQNEWLGSKFYQYTSHKNFLSITRKMLRIIKNNQEQNYIIIETDLTKKNGQHIPVEVYLNILYNEKNNPMGVQGTIRNISKRKQAEEALKFSKERWQITIDSIQEGLYDWDIKTNQVFYTDSFWRMLGYRPGDFTNTIQTIYELLHPEDLKKIQKVLIKLFQSNRNNISRDVRFKTRLRNYRWYRTSGSIISRSKNGEPLRMVGTVFDITERKNAEEQIKRNLKEKEVLLKEIHHRVKNNLQIMSSLLMLQSLKVNDPIYTELLNSSQARIRSMAIVHEMMYKSQEFTHIDMNLYLNKLLSNLKQLYLENTNQVNFELQCNNIKLNLNQAIPFGMILNELITNAMKHAFPDKRKGTIWVRLEEKAGKVYLSVQDDGVALPADHNYHKGKTLGMDLVSDLTGQLDGTLNITDQNGIKAFEIVFNKLSKK